jgi:hypothetical protein
MLGLKRAAAVASFGLRTAVIQVSEACACGSLMFAEWTHRPPTHDVVMGEWPSVLSHAFGIDSSIALMLGLGIRCMWNSTWSKSCSSWSVTPKCILLSACTIVLLPSSLCLTIIVLSMFGKEGYRWKEILSLDFRAFNMSVGGTNCSKRTVI